MEEKMEALEVLENAMNAVSNAMEAIDKYARQIGIHNKKVTIEELALMTAGKADVDVTCSSRILEAAFSLIRDLDLIVVAEEDNEDE